MNNDNMSNGNEHGAAAVERSLHLEEYSRTRPASAGSRPRSLLNKVANAAAAAQVDDDPEPADAEPWVLEGWGDGPSVSEAAQQAALRLAPHLKNVPTTLVGLGAGGRRVLSAGPQGRSPLKASEARRKPGSGPPILQAGRRIAAAAVRRAPPPRNLEVGDESDVEEPPPVSRAAPPAAGNGPGGSATSCSPGQAPGQARAGPAQRMSPSPVRPLAASPSPPQNGPGSSGRPVRREPGVYTTAHSPQQPSGPAARQPSPRSPGYRGPSLDGMHSGVLARTASGLQRASPTLAGASAGASHAPHPTPYGHPPLPPHGHLDPINVALGREGTPRGAAEAAAGQADARHGRASSSSGDVGELPRSSSFTTFMGAPTQALRNEHPGHIPHGLVSPIKMEPQSPHATYLAAQRQSSPSGPQAASPSGHGHHPPPPLPGLPGCRRTNSTGTGLSGWDPEAPAVPTPHHPHATGQVSPLSLWVGPTALGAGTAGLHVSTVPPSRGTAPPVGHQQRRDQLGGNSRLQRGGGIAPAGMLDLSLAPERTSAGRAPAGAAALHAQGSANAHAASPDASKANGPAGFGLPQQDALSEFCASRSDMGSAGAATPFSGGRLGGHGTLEARVPSQRGGTLNGLLPATSEGGPMRVTSLGKATTAIGRVS